MTGLKIDALTNNASKKPLTVDTVDIKQYLLNCQNRVNHVIETHLPTRALSTTLQEAIRYATLNAGKRIRPALIYATTQALGGDLNHADPAACAVELIHSFSLVHDDLPAMDNDDLRRGKPTCHIAYDEATAILVGDALQSLAFEVLAAEPCHSTPNEKCRLAMIRTLATAIGPMGMAAGQAIDLACEGKTITLSQLETMHALKTGELIRASVRLGALSAGCHDPKILHQLDEFAANMGTAFQVQDDILDIIGDTNVIGKRAGADAALGKATYPALLGLQNAQEKAQTLHQHALEALAFFDHKADPLRHLSNYIITRTY
jgi:geranylgeranyl diphosphate synthase type II